MEVAVNALSLWGAAVLLHAVVPIAASAADPSADDESPSSLQEGGDRWVPSFAVISGVTIQEWSGDGEGLLCPGCVPTSPDDPAQVSIRGSASGDTLDVTPFVGGSFELMTPELPLPGAPRLLVGGEILASFGADRTPARQRDPGQLSSPNRPGDNTLFDDTIVRGQGIETRAKFEDVAYGAHLGLAFPFQFRERQLRIKPSIGWIRYQVEMEGLLAHADCTNPNIFRPNACNDTNSFLRSTLLSGSKTETFHGIGPGLEIELDTGRLGPFGVSLLMGARFYRILGSGDIEITVTESFDDPVGAGDTATGRFSVEVDDWMYRFALGIRFHWLGNAD